MANPNKVGIVVGALIGGWHLCWALLVLLGWAQPIIDFIFWAHMVQPVYVIKPFDALAAITLIVVTAVIGYVFGFIGASIWNNCIDNRLALNSIPHRTRNESFLANNDKRRRVRRQMLTT